MSQPEFAHIQLSRVGTVVLIELVTKDIQGPKLALDLGTELQHVLAQDWAKRLLVNFHNVTYFSSTGFAVLFRLATEARKKGIEIKFCGMDGAVALGASIVGLEKVAEMHETREAALKAFEKV